MYSSKTKGENSMKTLGTAQESKDSRLTKHVFIEFLSIKAYLETKSEQKVSKSPARRGVLAGFLKIVASSLKSL